jgi:ring-1,2-phenylacetyl-CoA epoxidase subunit PaaD
VGIKEGIEMAEKENDTRSEKITLQGIYDALKTIDDPELPISIVDLGIVQDVKIVEDHVNIKLLPTFTGCPALGVIENNVKDTLQKQFAVDHIDVVWDYSGEWNSKMISVEARQALRSWGIAVNPDANEVECPYCSSPQVIKESSFGCALCRSIYYCKNCKNPFERIKNI